MLILEYMYVHSIRYMCFSDLVICVLVLRFIMIYMVILRYVCLFSVMCTHSLKCVLIFTHVLFLRCVHLFSDIYRHTDIFLIFQSLIHVCV